MYNNPKENFTFLHTVNLNNTGKYFTSGVKKIHKNKIGFDLINFHQDLILFPELNKIASLTWLNIIVIYKITNNEVGNNLVVD